MIKNIQWLKEEVFKIMPLENEMFNYPDDATIQLTGAIQEIIEMIDQIEQPKLIEIPAFVANWIDALTASGYDLVGAIYDGAYNEDMNTWLFEGDEKINRTNRIKLMHAINFGYIVIHK